MRSDRLPGTLKPKSSFTDPKTGLIVGRCVCDRPKLLLLLSLTSWHWGFKGGFKGLGKVQRGTVTLSAENACVLQFAQLIA